MLAVAEMVRHRGMTKCQPKVSSVCDRDPHCQKVLIATTQESTCIFSNFAEIVKVPAAFLKRSPSVQLQSISSLKFAGRARCLRHHRCCPTDQDLDAVFDGSPCTDWSPAGSICKAISKVCLPVSNNHVTTNKFRGSRLGYKGPTWPLTLREVFVLSSSKCGVHENVTEFPNIIEECLSNTHRVTRLIMHPAQLGFQLIARRRVYRIVSSKAATKMLFDPRLLYEHIVKTFAELNHRPMKIKDCFAATEAEVQAALQKRCKCRKKDECKCTFFSQLTKSQQKNYKLYVKMWRSPGCTSENMICTFWWVALAIALVARELLHLECQICLHVAGRCSKIAVSRGSHSATKHNPGLSFSDRQKQRRAQLRSST